MLKKVLKDRLRVLGWMCAGLVALAGCVQSAAVPAGPAAGMQQLPAAPLETRTPARKLTPIEPEAVDPTPTTPPPAPTIASVTDAPDPAGEDAALPAPVDPLLWEQGLALYREQSCGICHTLAVAETTGAFGPSHDGMAETAIARLQDSRYHGRATTPDAYVRESILDPGAYYVDGYQLTHFPMPVYTNLSDQEVEALVVFLLHPPPGE
ncbi:MAG: hypothetical protein Kow0063_11020 [Anaerolineae bacterium]